MAFVVMFSLGETLIWLSQLFKWIITEVQYVGLTIEQAILTNVPEKGSSLLSW